MKKDFETKSASLLDADTTGVQSAESVAKHTPGPWKICYDLDGDICIGTDEDDPWFIAQMCLGVGGADVKIDPEANAALIVRAVNAHQALVDALKFAKSMLVAFGGDPRTTIADDGSAMGDEIQSELLDQIEAALKLAESDK